MGVGVIGRRETRPQAAATTLGLSPLARSDVSSSALGAGTSPRVGESLGQRRYPLHRYAQD